ncbi:uncharacterized protein LOC144995454 [Oryzias latipes]
MAAVYSPGQTITRTSEGRSIREASQTSAVSTMKVYGILLLFCLLASLGLLTVLLGQYKEMNMIMEKRRSLDALALDQQKVVEYDAGFRRSLEALVAQGEETAKDLEGSVASFNLEQKTAEKDNCLEETKRKTEELASMEQAHEQTLGTLKEEVNSWKEELANVKGLLNGYAPICKYLKNGTAPSFRQLCGNKSS